MDKKIGLKALGLILFAGLILAEGQITSSFAQKETVIIGFSMSSLRIERWQKDRDFFVEKARQLGAEVNVLSANNNAGIQLSQAENLILQGVDVLVVVPQDAEMAAAIVEKAHDAGIKVVAYDRMIKNCDLDFYVSFDSVKVGEFQAQGVLKAVDKGDFAYIGGSPTDNNAFLLKKGSMNILGPRIATGDIKLVVDEFAIDWKPEEAYKIIKNYLEANEKIDAVVAANDGTAFGVITALEEYGLAGKVPVSGQDAELTACQRIVKGTQTVTVYKPIRSLAYKAAEIAVAIAKKQNVETNSKVNNGKTDVLSYLVESIPVTRENLAGTVIKDGFHTYEDVYKDTPVN